MHSPFSKETGVPYDSCSGDAIAKVVAYAPVLELDVSVCAIMRLLDNS
jgi:hypothetical protein